MFVGNLLQIQPIASRGWVSAIGQSTADEIAREAGPIDVLGDAVEEVVDEVNLAGESFNVGRDEVGVVRTLDERGDDILTSVLLRHNHFDGGSTVTQVTP